MCIDNEYMGIYLHTYSFLHILLFVGIKTSPAPSAVLHFVGFYFLLSCMENFLAVFSIYYADRHGSPGYSAHPVYWAVYRIVCCIR